MGATQVQFRRGTTEENMAFTGKVGEISVDTTLLTVRVHDGQTKGGHALSKDTSSSSIFSQEEILSSAKTWAAKVSGVHIFDLVGGGAGGSSAKGGGAGEHLQILTYLNSGEQISVVVGQGGSDSGSPTSIETSKFLFGAIGGQSGQASSSSGELSAIKAYGKGGDASKSGSNGVVIIRW